MWNSQRKRLGEFTSNREARLAALLCCQRPGKQEIVMAKSSFTAILEREGDLFVALCPELDVASQGTTVEEATSNLREAVELFLECADPAEVEARQHKEVFVTRFEAAHG